jgi:tetratricopeptide (TPR) repeat protein
MTPIEAAAQQTGDMFPEVEGLAETLLQWCDEASFLDLLSRLRGGDRSGLASSDEAIAELFIESTRFDFGDDTHSKGSEVVAAFLQTLETKLYESTEGLRLLATRGEVLHQNTVTAIEEVGDRIIAAIGSTPGRLASDVDADTISNAQLTGDEAAFARQIDTARDLLLAGKAGSALALLGQLAQRTAESRPISEELLYRLALNSGSANLDLGLPSEALAHYSRALELRPGDVRTLCGLAKTRLALGEPARALDLAEQALTHDAENVKAFGMKLLAMHQLGRDSDVDRLVVESRQLWESPLGSAILGELRLIQGRPSEAVPLLRRGLASDEVQPPFARMLLAAALVGTVKSQEAAGSDRTSGEEAEDAILREALEYFDRALEDMSSSEDRATYQDTLASRAGVVAMLGDATAAMADLDRVLGENPRNTLAIENKTRMLLLSERATEGLELLERLPKPLDRETRLLRASLFLRADRAADALETALAVWDESADDEGSQVHSADILIAAESKLGLTDHTSRVLDRLEHAWPDSAFALAVRAESAQRANNLEEAIALLERALSIAPSRFARQLSYQLAAMHYMSNDFSRSVDAYRIVARPEFLDPEFGNYLAALLRAGALAEILEVCKQARERVGLIPRIVEIEAHVLQLIGDLPSSEKLLDQWARQSPSDMKPRLLLLSIRLRMGSNQAAMDTALSIDVEAIWNDPHDLLDLAEARQILGLPDALEIAFRARRIGFDSPRVHQRYMTVFLNREEFDAALMNPTEVQVGSTVHLRHNEERVVWTILDEEDVSRSRGEISPTDDLSARLLERHAGDQVLVGPGAGLEYTIEEVQSKYVYAFQQTMLNFTVWFPEESELRRVEIRENDLSAVLLMVDEQHQAAEQVMELYRTKPLTLGVIAELLGRSIVDVWTGIVGIVGQRLYASAGDDDEARIALANLHSTESVAIDVAAILTLAHLRILDRAASALRILTPRSVITELRQHYMMHFEGATPVGTLGKQGTQYVRGEITTDDIERGRSFMREIIETLENRTEVPPVNAALALEPGKYEELQSTLGSSSADAVLIAHGTNSVLLSDDLRLRQLANSTFGVQGTWTQPLLSYLFEREVLARESYLDAVLTLLLSNYRHPRVSSDDLFDLLKVRNFELTPGMEALLQSALGPDYSELSVLGVASGLIKRVWRQSISLPRSEAMVGGVIASLMVGRGERRRLLGTLMGLLQREFRLDPLGFDSLAQFIQSWAVAHYI